MFSNVLAVTFIFLPAVAWLINLCSGKRIHGFLLYFMAAFVGYLCIVGGAMAKNAELDAEIKRYDLDGDGGYSEDELTPEAEKALDDWASDTGRQLAPIFGIPFAAIWYGLVLGILYFGEWLTRILFFRSKPPTEPESKIPDLKQPTPPDDGNPYRAPHS